MVDESSMVDTKALAAVHEHVTAAGAKWLLTGDHRQCSAIGAGGGMELIVDAGAAYELTEARRFTHEWERDASLRLRAGDESVLAEYHKHGRLLDAGTLEQAEGSAATAWLADTLAGKHSLLSVNSNDQAARLSAKLRAELVRLCVVDAAGGVPVGIQGNYAGVNDLVQARRIARELVGYEGNRAGPVNRQQYRVLSTRDDGGLVVVPVLGRGVDGAEEHGEPLTLPGSYVAEHIELGYAATAYSIQGVTVGTSHNLATPQTSRAAFYMAMTRGQDSNTAHMATQTVPDPDPAPGAVHDAIHRSPAAILALAFERDEPLRPGHPSRLPRRGPLGANRDRPARRIHHRGHHQADRPLARPARRPRPPHPQPTHADRRRGRRRHVGQGSAPRRARRARPCAGPATRGHRTRPHRRATTQQRAL
jgi:hypothetical protein